ncbi:MAG: hypothetical protein NTW95_09530 [Candidatus Aminicenantes bacterium]|nr:hypothetical protein [Candidatus Aminicenantes bacterium]
MKPLHWMIVLIFLCAWQPAQAQDQQMDMEAMMRWSSADVVCYHIVGVYQAQTNVIGGSGDIGYADVTDRVVIDLKWRLTESTLVGTPTILNEKSAVKNLRNYEPKCRPPVLKGEYEHWELLGVKDGLSGVLELQVQTTYPAADVAQFCTGKNKAVPGSVKKHPEELIVLSPVMLGMSVPESDNLRISKDKKSLIHKQDGWTWTFTPTLEPAK